ncbi:MAG: rRNA pseudouridine synthase [Gemmatimonadetes bacterium]|nr:rRNA pseudouridine synthase [Gemmatimonadota bacterium]
MERALSKLGFASRTQARGLVEAGRVRVNGRVVQDPLARVDVRRARFEVDGTQVRAERRSYIALNKPAGLVTSERDERGRDTVFSCLADANLPRLVAVGRLDRESEGLLLFTNDTRWAQRVLDPAGHIQRVYQVHIRGDAPDELLAALRAGVTSRGELLRVGAARRVRSDGAESVLELVLGEGRNRHIRRMLEGLGREITVLRRVAIGPVQLGRLGAGAHRTLTPAEIEALGGAVGAGAEAGRTRKPGPEPPAGGRRPRSPRDRRGE